MELSLHISELRPMEGELRLQPLRIGSVQRVHRACALARTAHGRRRGIVAVRDARRRKELRRRSRTERRRRRTRRADARVGAVLSARRELLLLLRPQRRTERLARHLIRLLRRALLSLVRRTLCRVALRLEAREHASSVVIKGNQGQSRAIKGNQGRSHLRLKARDLGLEGAPC